MQVHEMQAKAEEQVSRAVFPGGRGSLDISVCDWKVIGNGFSQKNDPLGREVTTINGSLYQLKNREHANGVRSAMCGCGRGEDATGLGRPHLSGLFVPS